MPPRSRRRLQALSVGMFLVVSILSVSVASATPTGQIFLDPSGSLAAGCAPNCPFADVNITLNSSTQATVTFSTPASNYAGSGGFTFLMGGVGNAGGPGGNIIGLNIFDSDGTLPTVTVTNITPTYEVGSSADTSGVVAVLPLATQSVDGVKNYSLFLTWGDGAAHGSNDLLSSLSFVITNTSGTWGCIGVAGTPACAAGTKPLIDTGETDATDNHLSWTDSITGTTVTSDSWAMAHFSRCFTADLPSSCGSTGVVTAWAGGAAVQGVPEPGTLALLGSGLLALGMLGRHFRK